MKIHRFFFPRVYKSPIIGALFYLGCVKHESVTNLYVFYIFSSSVFFQVPVQALTEHHS